MATSYYSTGTVSLTAGSAVVTGTGTAWQTVLITGGNIFVQAPGNPLPIASVDSDTQITAELEWTGASGTYEYRLQLGESLQANSQNMQNLVYLLSELRQGTLFKYDAAGTLADRDLFDGRPKGYSYLVFSDEEAELYVKASNTSGDWAGPFAYGTGPIGPQGPIGTLNPMGTYSAGTAYDANDNVLYQGSSWVALQSTTGIAPPTLPTTSNAHWSLVAAKGMDGTGIGDMLASVYDPQSRQTDVFANRAELTTPNSFTKIQKWARGVDVASAAALTLGDDGNYFAITGTTTITSIATKGVGTVVKLHFDAALTITHSATDLVLPGGVNIITAAGDEAEFVEYGTGRWRCVSYQRGASLNIGRATSKPTTSGTSHDFLNLPGWVKRITVIFDQVSLSGTDDLLVQIGSASGGVETNGYSSGSGLSVNSGAGFIIRMGNNVRACVGHMILTNPSGNVWIASHAVHVDSSVDFSGAGRKTLSGIVDRVRIKGSGSDMFNSGSVNLLYE